jgi:hypothetical protein
VNPTPGAARAKAVFRAGGKSHRGAEGGFTPGEKSASFPVRMNRETSFTAKPLPLAERKRILAELKAKAPTEKIRRGLELIDLDRELTPREIAYGKTLLPRVKEILARKHGRAAA